MPSVTVVVDGLVPPARIVIGCPRTEDGWGGWTVARLKTETQKRLLDIYHCDQAVATITDEAGGSLYGPDKLADLGIYAGTVLRAVPAGARPYLELLPAAGQPEPQRPPPGLSSSWALEALDRAISEKDALIAGLSGITEHNQKLQSNGGGEPGSAAAGQDVLAAIDKVMAERETVLADLDGLASEETGHQAAGGAK
jgi:hypothetical protein